MSRAVTDIMEVNGIASLGRTLGLGPDSGPFKWPYHLTYPGYFLVWGRQRDAIESCSFTSLTALLSAAIQMSYEARSAATSGDAVLALQSQNRLENMLPAMTAPAAYVRAIVFLNSHLHLQTTYMYSLHFHTRHQTYYCFRDSLHEQIADSPVFWWPSAEAIDSIFRKLSIEIKEKTMSHLTQLESLRDEYASGHHWRSYQAPTRWQNRLCGTQTSTVRWLPVGVTSLELAMPTHSRTLSYWD